MMHRPTVSVIVSFYERIQHLKICLDSLMISHEDIDEIIVTDDGSSKETVERVRAMIDGYGSSVRHVWQQKQGFRAAAARNNGIRHARGDYLIFLDCDFVILPGAIREHLKRRKARRFVAGHCKYLEEDQSASLLTSTVSPQFIGKLYEDLPEGEIRKTHRRFMKRTVLMRLHLASPKKQSLGGHLSIHRKDIESVNGYDENFVGWGGEDEDLGIRLVRAGIFGLSAIRYARVLHVWHPKELGEKHWSKGPNIDYFRNENRPAFCENGLVKRSCMSRSIPGLKNPGARIQKKQ